MVSMPSNWGKPRSNPPPPQLPLLSLRLFGVQQLELSTKPKKALGDAKLWEVAEGSLREALDEFAGKGTWRVNPGDGAFYGPKIDIKVSRNERFVSIGGGRGGGVMLFACG